MLHADIAIIGSGIVGLATAYHLLQTDSSLRVVLLDKEKDIALHQTGRNSGVLHSGIYYKPGSLKAQTCREGKKAMEQFCQSEDVPYELCGKVIVAVEEKELPGLERIYQRGQANHVICSLIGPDELREIEPHVAGIRAIHVPEAGIVDYTKVCHALRRNVIEKGGELRLNFEVRDVTYGSNSYTLKSKNDTVVSKLVVNCAGLFSDRIARLAGEETSFQIVPFRGEYFTLNPSAERLCNGLIYPVPDPGFPFLGVHFTRMIQGGVECGPNAVLAFAREGYTRTTINARDVLETLSYPGFQQLARKHWKQGIVELKRSFSKKAFVNALQRLIPVIQPHDVAAAPAGVRAQAVTANGSLVDDFLIIRSKGFIHVGNAPSPAATASLQIGKHIAQKVFDE